MKFSVFRKDKDICTLKDFEDCEGREEIALILMELKVLEQELILMFDEYEGF